MWNTLAIYSVSPFVRHYDSDLIIIFIANYYLSNSNLKTKQKQMRERPCVISTTTSNKKKYEKFSKKKQEKRKNIKIQTDKTTYVT